MDKLINVLKSGSIVVPLYLLKSYKELNIELNDFIFLMYLYNKGNNFSFDPNKISNDLGISIKDVLTSVNTLSEKHLIEVKVIKNDRNINEEIICLDLFYNKVINATIDEVVDDSNKKIDSDIFEFIEKEFGRTLSSTEYEIIKAWLDSGNSSLVVKEAVKEAKYNGVSNLRYIDKILYEWGKKGIKTLEDVEKNRINHRKMEEDSVDDIYDYDWIDDDIDE